MTRVELYHDKPKQFHWKGPFLIILACFILAFGIYQLNQYWHDTIRIDAPKENLGKKVVVHLPNGQEVYTYENLIVKKDGKTYYKGERNTIDLTGGTIDYKNW
ncbi:hypothetical protein ACQYAD_12910 [Neobacillus sp. SM06]|uniref:hypothetical protein n=1 Tax=Neobacillus sp. SM06 TaxID=3422492 RepID=UPI003D2A66E6